MSHFSGDLASTIGFISKTVNQITDVFKKTGEKLQPVVDTIKTATEAINSFNKSASGTSSEKAKNDDEDKYFRRAFHLENLRSDLNLWTDSVSAISDLILLEGSWQRAHKKYYETVFLPSVNLTKDRVVNGDVTVAELREIFKKDTLFTRSTRTGLSVAKEPFDSSDFLNWDLDRPLYEKYHLITHVVYPRLLMGDLIKSELVFVMNSLERVRDYLVLGFPERQVQETMTYLRSLFETKPSTLEEINGRLSDIFSDIKKRNEQEISVRFVKMISDIIASPSTQKTQLPEEFWATIHQ